MKKSIIFLTISILTFTSYIVSYGQTTKGPSIEIVPQNGNYLYHTGETAVMDVHVITPGNLKTPSVVTYRLSLDGSLTLEEGVLNLDKGKGRISGRLDQPGFLRCDITCTVGDDTLHAACGCGFNVEDIRPAGQLPENFDRFWREAKAELLRIPIDARLEEVSVVDPGDAQRFKVSLANVNGSRVYGWLHLPEGDGPFPTVLSIPGSGIGRTGRFAGFTEAGIAVLAIEVHGLEPQKHEIIGAVQWMRPTDEEIDSFVELQEGILSDYHSFGREDPYRYFHRRSLQSAMRALDYLYTRTDVDTSQIIVFGGSQGGGLSLLLGAIDKRVNIVVATVPGFCNNATRFSGTTGRAGEPDDILMRQVNRTMSYYDAALAAELIQVPTMIGVGFIDKTCFPSNVYSAYNNLKGVKKIENFYTFGHGAPPDWREKTIQWILENRESSHMEHPDQTTKPWAYWWWMGNSVTKEGVTHNLKAYKDAGLGGLHIIPIYGEKGDEDNYIEYLSPQWMEMLVHTVSEATELGLGIDMTTGTGWPFGGPNISLEHSAKKFELKELDLIIQPTGQKVKRAAPGGEGLVMDYFSKEALNIYFERFQSAFDSTKFRSGKVRAFYNDSYEVYGANFTSDFLEKFNELRGYNLTNYLHVLADTVSTETRERIVTDYRETLSDLLYSEFTRSWVHKSHELGMLTRNQAHGSPGNILDLYGEVDIPETESFGTSDFSIPGLRKNSDYEEENFGRPSPFTMKFASSAAHLKNRKLVASETATWLDDHFKVALSQVKPQIDELFTAGINHIIYHGITYNPPGKPFPGRLFYASTNFGTESHFWNELPALNKYIERCQTVLQNTKPHNDVLVYFPIHDLWAKKSTDEFIIHIDVHHSREWLEETNFGKVISQLWKDGFTFDYVSDRILAEASVKENAIQFEGGEYKTMVVPECTYIPDQTMENFIRLAEAGANIIFLEKLPETVAGFNQFELRQEKLALQKKRLASQVTISNDISSELQKCGIAPEELAASGLSFIRKKGEDGMVYFISNLSDKFHAGNVELTTESEQVEIFDPLSGKKGMASSRIVDGKTEVLLHLEPGQSCILRCSARESGGEKWSYYHSLNDTITIDTEWTITPVSGAPKLPDPVQTEYLKSWTQFGDDYAVFSGKAVYSAEFEMDDKYISMPFRIDLGDVRETARLTINDHEIGLLWCIPYTAIIPSDILKQHNKIEIEVTNLSFNRVIDLDKKGVQWRNFHEINFVNIKYKPYDASDKEPVESGLLDEIRLIPLKK